MYGLAIPLAYPSGEEGGTLLVQMISNCVHCAERKGGQDPVILTYTVDLINIVPVQAKKNSQNMWMRNPKDSHVMQFTLP
jgi:hypothetical protein